jgi:uncharacterized membrane protein YjjB (DUF3815 family)
MMTHAVLLSLFAAVASVGFCFIFRVPRKLLFVVALLAFCGFFARELSLKSLGLGLEMSTLLGAMTIGLMAGYASKLLKVPTQILTVGSAIPMIPGTLAFGSIKALIEFISAKEPAVELLVKFSYLSAKTMFTMGALAFGITVFTMFFKKSEA